MVRLHMDKSIGWASEAIIFLEHPSSKGNVCRESSRICLGVPQENPGIFPFASIHISTKKSRPVNLLLGFNFKLSMGHIGARHCEMEGCY